MNLNIRYSHQLCGETVSQMYVEGNDTETVMDLELRRDIHGRVQTGFLRCREVNFSDIFLFTTLDWITFHLFCEIFF